MSRKNGGALPDFEEAQPPILFQQRDPLYCCLCGQLLRGPFQGWPATYRGVERAHMDYLSILLSSPTRSRFRVDDPGRVRHVSGLVFTLSTSPVRMHENTFQGDVRDALLENHRRGATGWCGQLRFVAHCSCFELLRKGTLGQGYAEAATTLLTVPPGTPVPGLPQGGFSVRCWIYSCMDSRNTARRSLPRPRTNASRQIPDLTRVEARKEYDRISRVAPHLSSLAWDIYQELWGSGSAAQ